MELEGMLPSFFFCEDIFFLVDETFANFWRYLQ
jgi:hypothetical protein